MLHNLYDMMTAMMKLIATTEDFTCLSCSYDIIANDKLTWDSNKPIFTGKSVLYEIVKPLGELNISFLQCKSDKLILVHIVRERCSHHPSTEDQENLREHPGQPQ